jgi:DNA-binding NarL/FixJ family response regulator
MQDASQVATNREICVGIVDDHDAIRFAFRGVCEEYGLKFCGASDTVAGLLALNSERAFDVVVLDLSLADGSIITDNVKAILQAGSQVLIFSIADKRAQVASALKAGAAALVRKSQSMDDLVKAIRLVALGVVVNNTETSAVIDADVVFKEQANLSPREREVLTLYASGFALKQAAAEMNIAQSTAKELIDRVRAKYSSVGRPTSTKTDLLLRAIEDGILEEGPQ